MVKASLVLLLSTVIVAAAAVGETADRDAPTDEQKKLDAFFTKLLKEGIVPMYIVTSKVYESIRKYTKVQHFRQPFYDLLDTEKPNLNDILERGFMLPILNIEQLPRSQKAVTECDEGQKDSRG
eukprot:GHVU01167945.1.p1 GENE.GHVU01167945.1~~GHVU01167945.1.p1  ORF type:complete len:124 (+),score=13.25 GHVU01167945.1:128-499(+)